MPYDPKTHYWPGHLSKRCSKKSLQANIDKMRHARGKHKPPTPQELAIGYSVLRRACGMKSKGQKLTPKQILQKYRKNKKAKVEDSMVSIKSVDQITEMLAAPVMGALVPIPALANPVDSKEYEERQGVLMAIDDIDRQLNYYDQLAHKFRMDGRESEANELKDMANTERKNKVRLRDMLKVLEAGN
ncbi:MAG: hypothetical protein HQK96_08305 [Nitrospirae bacterium]|nr:hypothetical protein [Nitrospirota bacterium]